MTNNQISSTPLASTQEDEINLLDLLLVLAKNKAMIIKVTLASALLAAAVVLMLDNIYTGTAKVLPPQSSQSSASNAIMLAQLGGLASAAGNALGLKDPNALYVAMLKSRTIMETIVRRFDLKAVYDEKTMIDTIKELEKKSSIVSGKDSVIVVEVDDKDPQRAADMANAYIEELNKLMQTLAITEASQRRRFFENQMKPAKDKLTDAEITLDKTLKTSLQYMDALRNLRYQESLYEILIRQFEAAKLDEAKDSPLIQILDKASPPEIKSKPRRSLIVIFTTMGALFLAMIWAFVREATQRAREQPEQAARLTELRSAFRFRR